MNRRPVRRSAAPWLRTIIERAFAYGFASLDPSFRVERPNSPDFGDDPNGSAADLGPTTGEACDSLS